MLNYAKMILLEIEGEPASRPEKEQDMSSNPLIVMIHTVAPLVGVFTALAREMLPGVTVKHILDEPLLDLVRARGSLDAADSERLAAHIAEAQVLGAAGVLVTCSTVSPLVDEIRQRVKPFVIKIDEAMIAEAVRGGGRVGVLATNPATLEPTRLLLEAQARSVGQPVTLDLRVVEGAFDAFLSGDMETHDRLLLGAIDAAAPGVDRVVLAQASMARILPRLPASLRVPVLASPIMALEEVKSKLG